MIFFGKTFYFNKNLPLVFIYLFVLSGGMKAKAYKISENDIGNWGKSCSFQKDENRLFFSSPSDTLKGFSKKENLQDWEILFDGTNTDKWKGKDTDTFRSHGWTIEKGALVLNTKGAAISPPGRNLKTLKSCSISN
jgi:hypothetical protein